MIFMDGSRELIRLGSESMKEEDIVTQPCRVAIMLSESEILTRMVSIFEELGATNIQEVSVEEALKSFHIMVSEESWIFLHCIPVFALCCYVEDYWKNFKVCNVSESSWCF